MPLTLGLAKAIKSLADEASVDPDLLDALVFGSEEDVNQLVSRYITNIGELFAGTPFNSLQFATLDGTGYALIVPKEATLVVVVCPSRDAIRRKIVGEPWPSGSSPELKPPPAGCVGDPRGLGTGKR